MAKAVAQSISLKPQRDLFDPDFEGYKLSSDGELTVYSRAVPEGKAVLVFCWNYHFYLINDDSRRVACDRSDGKCLQVSVAVDELN